MKRLLVFSLFCVTLAFCRTLPRIRRSPPTMFPVEQLVLNQISMIVLLHNSSKGILAETDMKTPLPKLTNCVTSQQREVIKTCAKGILPPLADEPKASGNAGSDFRPHMIPPTELTKIVECIWDQSAVIEKDTSRINVTNLKAGVIDHSSLTAAQKTSAAESLNACLKTDLSSSPVLAGKTADVVFTDKMKSVFSAALCSFKSVIDHGCSEHDGSSQKLITQHSAESLELDSSHSAETLGNVSGSLEVMSQMKKRHDKCGTAHHQCTSQGGTSTNTRTTAPAAAAAAAKPAASPSASAPTA